MAEIRVSRLEWFGVVACWLVTLTPVAAWRPLNVDVPSVAFFAGFVTLALWCLFAGIRARAAREKMTSARTQRPEESLSERPWFLALSIASWGSACLGVVLPLRSLPSAIAPTAEDAAVTLMTAVGLAAVQSSGGDFDMVGHVREAAPALWAVFSFVAIALPTRGGWGEGILIVCAFVSSVAALLSLCARFQRRSKPDNHAAERYIAENGRRISTKG